MVKKFHCFIFVLSLLWGCKQKNPVKTAFYYWKSSFKLNSEQSDLLKQTASNTLYIRFFDIAWDNKAHKAFPNAILHFKDSVNQYQIIPVVYITNKIFENIETKGIDGLAFNCDKLIAQLASSNHILYECIQFDCDWTTGTQEKYFTFLKAFKKANRHKTEATIRLHQVKYKNATGIPPVDKGVLMFYNMGKPDAGEGLSRSIYNPKDAGKYIDYLSSYPLSLDVALPLFSWAYHIRDKKIIQVYQKINRRMLSNSADFEHTGNVYRAKRSFYLSGIYIKESDIFKLEETGLNTLREAAGQLSQKLHPQSNRTVIYYELANVDLEEFKPKTLLKVSADF